MFSARQRLKYKKQFLSTDNNKLWQMCFSVKHIDCNQFLQADTHISYTHIIHDFLSYTHEFEM